MLQREGKNIVKENRAISIIAFVLLALMLFVLLPKKQNISYDYKKGRPWLHADLIAPFDFSIIKTPDEIQKEKDSISENFAPYFILKKQVVQQVQAEAIENIDRIFKEKKEAGVFTAILPNLFL
ncbi:MAG: hypothetical protein GX879_00480, partial [Bacteroidales bacterium]|nr:hypothetical protein [Bacteroidales bacterium]